jgi:hypothetical protein
LDFFGARPNDRESKRFQGLEKLGFPWILSSESRLFNGLRAIFAKRKFLAPFAHGGAVGAIGDTGWHPGTQDCASDELNSFSDFLQSFAIDTIRYQHKLSSIGCLSAASIQKQRALERSLLPPADTRTSRLLGFALPQSAR